MKTIIFILALGLVQNAFANTSIAIEWSNENVTLASDTIKDGTYIRITSPLIAGKIASHSLFTCYSMQATTQCNVNSLRNILNKKVIASVTITERSRSCAYCDYNDSPRPIFYEVMTLRFENGLTLQSNASLR